jgi:hypothetical protein
MGYIPTHRSTTQKKRGLKLAGAAVALGTTLAIASPAAAFDNYTEAIANDGQSVGRCALTLTNADYAGGTVRANINASVKPASLTKALQNTHVAIICYLFDKDSGNFLRADQYEADGTVIAKSKITTVPLTRDYVVCSLVATTLRSGATVVSPVVCAG